MLGKFVENFCLKKSTSEKKHFTTDFEMCADYSFLYHWLGISPTGNQFCILCCVNKKSAKYLDFDHRFEL